MALPASGTIDLLDIADEFPFLSDATPHSISEFYSAASGVPASGTIDFADFYGTSGGPNVAYHGRYYTGTSGDFQTITINVPSTTHTSVIAVVCASAGTSTKINHNISTSASSKGNVGLQMMKTAPAASTGSSYYYHQTVLDITTWANGVSGNQAMYIVGGIAFGCYVYIFTYDGSRRIGGLPYEINEAELHWGDAGSQTYVQPAAGWAGAPTLGWWARANAYTYGTNVGRAREYIAFWGCRVTGGGRLAVISRPTVGPHDSQWAAMNLSDGWALAWGTYSDHTTTPASYPSIRCNEPTYSGEHLAVNMVPLIV